MLLALSDVTYVLIGWFKFLLLKFLYEYGPRPQREQQTVSMMTDARQSTVLCLAQLSLAADSYVETDSHLQSRELYW